MPTVLLVDDHAGARTALRRLLGLTCDLSVVGEAADGAQAVSLAAELRPDLVVMDLSMPTLDGVEATRRIRVAAVATRIVVLTGTLMRRREALAAGASAFVLKDAPPASLLEALRA